MPKLTINGQEVEVEAGLSILQACETLGIEIPRFCYHDRLSVPANCRMCLVKQVGVPKPVPSCAIPVAEGMEINTDSDAVHKARKGVMEFLLINHPLDCPICDQGGECDLQDQAVAYGFDRSRYFEPKRAVADKELGPLIKTVMTRCIHCTRCIRFGEQIGGVNDLGLLGRGEQTEVGTFIESFTDSELSGNLVDVCPVGALTSKPYAFKARPWELRKTESIDVMDAVGSSIRVDTRGHAEVMRILPRLHEDVNEEWISDKTRYAYDGLMRQRLDHPYLRNKKTGKMEKVDWPTALDTLADKLGQTKPEKVGLLAGDLVNAEAVAALGALADARKMPHRDCRVDGATYDISDRSLYTMNTGIADLETADVILLVGTFPRWEAPLVNARIRKAFYEHNAKIAVIGEDRREMASDYNYDVTYLGETADVIDKLAAPSKAPKDIKAFADLLKNAKRPAVILGADPLAREDGKALQKRVLKLAEKYKIDRTDWHGFNVLQEAAGRVGALDLGFVPQNKGKATREMLAAARKGQIEVLYLLGVDQFTRKDIGKKPFVIYQGHHGDQGANAADLILPAAAYTEDFGTYVNTEGRVQHARQAMFPLGDAKPDWKIIRAVSEVMAQRDTIAEKLPFETLADVRSYMAAKNVVFAEIDALHKRGALIKSAKIDAGDIKLDTKTPLGTSINNFYMTCPISRASVTMAQSTQAFINRQRDYKNAQPVEAAA